MSSQRHSRQKKPVQNAKTKTKTKSSVSNMPTLSPETASAHSSEVISQVPLNESGANEVLRQETLLHLQRQHGNAYVQRLVAGKALARPTGQRSAEVIARRAHGPAAAEVKMVRPNAANLVSSQYPGLKLPPAKLATLQKILDARYNLHLLAKKAARYPKHGLSSEVRKREAIEHRMRPHQDLLRDHYYARFKTEGLAVDTDLVLGKDILGKKDKISAPERAFRSSLYKTLISHKTILVIRGGANPKPLFKFMWARPSVPWELSQEGGQVKFKDLMKIEKFNLAYQSVLLGRLAEVTGKLEEGARATGGKLYKGYGKKIGETYGKWWNTTVKLGMELGRIGGYVPDARGESELQGDLMNAATAKAVVKAPDGFLHLFALTPAIMSWDMKEPGNDGYVYLLDKGAEVIPERIVTKDRKELHRGTGKAGIGWRTHKTMSEVEQFAVGAFFGDFVEDPSVTMMVGQMLVGVIPIVGQLADIRDLAAGIYKMWKTGGKDGKVQTLMALIAFVPLFGDGIKLAKKALAKGGRTAAIRAFVTKLRPGLSDATGDLARKMISDSAAVAKKIGISPKKLAKESRKLSSLAATAVTKGGKASAERYARKMEILFEKVGGDPSALVAIGGGSWAKVAKALAASPAGSTLGKKMQVWRVKQFKLMENEVKKSASKFSSDIPGGSPKMVSTGTPSFKSDIDISFMGPNATVHRNAARKIMETRFGPRWDKLLDADIFADPRRLTMFEGPMAKLPPKAARALEKRLVAESELNVLAKMLMKGGDEAAVKKMAKNLGVKMTDVTARASELKSLTKETIARLELKLDVLHRRFLEAKSPGKKAMIAEEMSTLQSKLNAVVEGPYLTPGGAAKHVTRREAALRVKGPFTKMSPPMLYTAILDDFYMLQKVLAKVDKVGNFTEKTAKNMAKYANRLLVSAGQIGGIDVAKVSASKALFENIDGILRRSRLEKGAKPLADAARFLEEAKKGLAETINSMSSEVKKKSDAYLATLPTSARIERTSTKTYKKKLALILSRELGILTRFKLRKGTSPTTSEEKSKEGR